MKGTPVVAANTLAPPNNIANARRRFVVLFRIQRYLCIELKPLVSQAIHDISPKDHPMNQADFQPVEILTIRFIGVFGGVTPGLTTKKLCMTDPIGLSSERTLASGCRIPPCED